MAKSDLTAERLRERLVYAPDTGLFFWRGCQGKKAGTTAGAWKGDGYIRIIVDREAYQAHRLAYLYVHGTWPAGEIDHRDRNRSNNRIGNLREITKSGNQQNRQKPRVDNKLGLLGVAPCGGVFRAQITINKRQIYLGCYKTPEQAHAAYVEAKRRLHPDFTP